MCRSGSAALYRFYHNHSWLLRERINDLEQAVAILRTSEAIGTRGIVLGRLLAILGWFYSNWWVLNPVKAKTVAKESLDLLQRLGAQEETIVPLLCTSMHQESLEGSGRLLSETLTLARQFGDRWAIGHALLELGENAVEGYLEQFRLIRSPEACNAYRLAKIFRMKFLHGAGRR